MFAIFVLVQNSKNPALWRLEKRDLQDWLDAVKPYSEEISKLMKEMLPDRWEEAIFFYVKNWEMVFALSPVLFEVLPQDSKD